MGESGCRPSVSSDGGHHSGKTQPCVRACRRKSSIRRRVNAAALCAGATTSQDGEVAGASASGPAWWAAARKARGDRDGTCALIEVLLLHRRRHDHVVAGLAAALRAGALTADAVALEARKAAETDTKPEDTGSGLSPRWPR